MKESAAILFIFIVISILMAVEPGDSTGPVVLETMDGVQIKLGNSGEELIINADETGIGVPVGGTPEAIFEIRSSESGILIPRLSRVERDAIISPATGLLIYNTDCGNFNYFDGTAWINLPDAGEVIMGSVSGADEVCSGATGIAYSVTPVTGALSYSWTLPPGATIVTGSGTTSITVDYGTDNGTVAVTAYTSCSSAISDLDVTVHPLPTGGNVTGGATICLGEETGILTLSGHSGDILRWQRRVDAGVWADISHTLDTYFETPSSEGTWEYRAVIGSGPCDPAYSSAAIVTVESPSVGGDVTGGGIITLGDPTPTLTLTSYTGSILRWQKRLDGILWSDIVHTAATYSETPVIAGIWEYRAEVQRGSCPAVFSLPETVAVSTEMDDTVTFNYSGSIVQWTVPAGIFSVVIEAWGGQGSNGTTGSGGFGARMKGSFTVTPGQVLDILVGQQGQNNPNSSSHLGHSTGGGGGSFVANNADDTPLLVAGGGGGTGYESTGLSASISTTGVTGRTGTNGPGNTGGTAGNGGGADGSFNSGQGGGGFYSNGGAPSGDSAIGGPGYSYLSGGAGGSNGDHSGAGGFGGGGGGGNYGGGGGGGYSGGGGGGSNGAGGGGGGSYNAGTDQDNSVGTRTGSGLVRIYF